MKLDHVGRSARARLAKAIGEEGAEIVLRESANASWLIVPYRLDEYDAVKVVLGLPAATNNKGYVGRVSSKKHLVKMTLNELRRVWR